LDSLLGMQQNKLNEEVVDNHFHWIQNREGE
jgi:hypothetical protein